MATQLPSSQRQPDAPAKADDPNPVPRHGSDKAADILPFPVADVPPGVLIRAGRVPHRFAGTPVDETTVRQIRERMSKTVHVRLTDSVQVGENEFEELGNRLADWAIAIGFVLTVVSIIAILAHGYFGETFG